jgi:tRNA modification GTPase
MTQTIFAPMTMVGRSAVTSLRLSGPKTGGILRVLAGPLPPARQARLRRLRDDTGEVLDEALVLWMPGPHSYTGEDTAELHLHGGRAVLEGVASALTLAGARFAEPGEFSRRAFVNGRLDLLQAEAVSDLVAAETAGQRRQALRQLEGGLGAVYASWSDRLTQLLAHQEALIDFPDEDLPPEIEAALRREMSALQEALRQHLDAPPVGERMREGLVFVVQGPPNAGKSTLVNALAGRQVAIVAPTPGTTRDALEVSLILGDVPVTLIDTAGLRDTVDPVEAEGVRRSLERAAGADLVLRLVDPLVEASEFEALGFPAPARAPGQTSQSLAIGTKRDLGIVRTDVALSVSAQSGAGLDDLRHRLSEIARAMTAQAGPPPLTRERHRRLVREAHGYLSAAIAEEAAELRAEELRAALLALGGLTGKVGVEQLLDRIFGAFCIGK